MVNVRILWRREITPFPGDTLVYNGVYYRTDERFSADVKVKMELANIDTSNLFSMRMT